MPRRQPSTAEDWLPLVAREDDDSGNTTGDAGAQEVDAPSNNIASTSSPSVGHLQPTSAASNRSSFGDLPGRSSFSQRRGSRDPSADTSGGTAGLASGANSPAIGGGGFVDQDASTAALSTSVSARPGSPTSSALRPHQALQAVHPASPTHHGKHRAALAAVGSPLVDSPPPPQPPFRSSAQQQQQPPPPAQPHFGARPTMAAAGERDSFEGYAYPRLSPGIGSASGGGNARGLGFFDTSAGGDSTGGEYAHVAGGGGGGSSSASATPAFAPWSRWQSGNGAGGLLPGFNDGRKSRGSGAGRSRGGNGAGGLGWRGARALRNLVFLAAIGLLGISIANSARPTLVRDSFSVLSDNLSAIRLWSPKEAARMRTLDERLRELMERPALDQWEMEHLNRHECPFYTFSRNTYFYHDGKDKEWEDVKRADVVRYRNAMVSHLKEVEASGDHLVWTPEYARERSGGEIKRGIILTGGEGSSFQRLKMLLGVLRGPLGSTLPVEVYHFPDELTKPEMRAELEAFGSLRIRILDGKHADGKNWHIKNSAFLQSEFTEFIYLDSDNIPLIDPAEHFDSVEYRTKGSAFWPDLYKDHPDNSIWRVLGRECSDDYWPFEAGQIVFDKRANDGLNLAVLHLANHMMQNQQMYGFLSYGDKDVFRYSFYALGLEYGFVPRIFATTGGFQTQNGETSPDYFCGHSMLQWGLTPWSKRNDKDYHPEPAFLHTILAKHRQNLQADKLWSHIRKPRLDNITEPSLRRTLYEFTGDCFALTLKGPDGAKGAENSFGDGQGVLTLPLEDAFTGGKDNKMLQEVQRLAQPFVDINVHH